PADKRVAWQEAVATESPALVDTTMYEMPTSKHKRKTFTKKTTEQGSQIEKQSILIVDDDPINLQVIQSILADESYEMTTVAKSSEALRLINKKNWDLLIFDIMMPEISGYELTETVRKQYSLTELPILLLTARSAPQDIQTGFLVGANDYVTKPVEKLE